MTVRPSGGAQGVSGQYPKAASVRWHGRFKANPYGEVDDGGQFGWYLRIRIDDQFSPQGLPLPLSALFGASRRRLPAYIRILLGTLVYGYGADHVMICYVAGDLMGTVCAAAVGASSICDAV